MSRKIAFVRFGRAALLVMAVLTGCEQGQMPGPVSEEVLRTRSDETRGRIWVLGLEDLRVYEASTRKLVRRIILPGWSVARYKCRPDLALDASGSAIVSSNVVPMLWHIDPESFAVARQAIRLEGKEGWDIGFGLISPAADGSLQALTSNGMSLWKVEFGGARAALVATFLPPVQDCALTQLRLSGTDGGSS